MGPAKKLAASMTLHVLDREATARLSDRKIVAFGQEVEVVIYSRSMMGGNCIRAEGPADCLAPAAGLVEGATTTRYG